MLSISSPFCGILQAIHCTLLACLNVEYGAIYTTQSPYVFGWKQEDDSLSISVTNSTKNAIASDMLPHFVEVIYRGLKFSQPTILPMISLFRIFQVLWALGNIAGDTAHSREILEKHRFLQSLQTVLKTRQLSMPCLRTAMWALSNMSQGRCDISNDLVSFLPSWKSPHFGVTFPQPPWIQRQVHAMSP